ncbi:DUF2750 domain-containing protein [Pseudoalteromonas tunicata]|uniref:DUF2750 domain-containing protein n=1 Tax=Pseudoalteromonas tunicata D2 TaxID=87626 RepID=A4CEK7_9GAMM|nr:DUF2750 domain-containing protein [Pseudoalteromonas tunicata]ATC96000.1 hypothetical protein PTUN_a3721 [Pseudoalteromonas tunicata]AXT31531.1 DUF2750 domain-containing protein [Pseudoalteromonas tunicata]EAR26736.1 hypothetical protein PTD2_16366 [Pseudoalteromonas tunicata D2]MDP4984065.1 DUF2750 domain-containing protein [Pseudoalteromonas tunicata]MDP5213337.1 DUF2750 domain-containing protein [Pseudoalteromonas tunicata]
MTEQTSQLAIFTQEVNQNELLWALTAPDGGYVVCDSEQFEDVDVLLLWSNKETAKKHCCDEWADYTPVSISKEEYLEYWVEDLSEDNTFVGIQWTEEEACLELTAIDVAKALLDS